MKFTTISKILSVAPDWVVKIIANRLVAHLLRKYATIKVLGEKKLEINQPVIFICNHLSNSDGLVLNEVLKEIAPTFVSGTKLSADAVTNLGLHVVKTTNIKPNTANLEALKNIAHLVKQGESILIFPEGTRSRTSSLIEAKKGIFLILKMTKAPLVPIGIWGTEQLMPINEDGDMSSEFFQKANVFVNIGEQFSIPTREKGQDKKEFEKTTMNYIMKNIAHLLPKEYQGVYEVSE